MCRNNQQSASALLKSGIVLKLALMADRKRKLCKVKLTEELPRIDKRPTHIPTGKLIEVLNKRRRSLQMKLGLNQDTKQRVNEDLLPRVKSQSRFIIRKN
ncbi:hypothetical protein TorRG33x02_353200 [Trema orientale]|uniref:Uncharacterized protein n=1 Tax=Trema orientale TaxID=63057 RepID=A0A2P5AD93_TREOI|nr:hypothetical protein TorRG33x02_353200 [Trema orientale]